MKCADFRAKIVLYLSGELPAVEELPIKEHLRGCPGCSSFGRQTADLVRLTRAAAGPDSGVDVWPEVREQLQVKRIFSPKWGPAFALSLLLVASLSSRVVFSNPRNVNRLELEIVKELEFLDNFELCEELDTIEHLHLTS